MIARFSGATLGLLAFTVATLGGLWAGNPITVTLSRAIWSLVLFCMIGLLVGAAAQAVVNDHARKRFDVSRTAAGNEPSADKLGSEAGVAVAAGASAMSGARESG